MLAYCYFYIQDFSNAASYYEQLAHLFADVVEYKVYHAQALYQACLYDEAFKVSSQIDCQRFPAYKGQVTNMLGVLAGHCMVIAMCASP